MPNTPPRYPSLTNNYSDNVALLDSILRVDASFDLIKKPLKVGQDEMTLYYIDGFIKDTVMMKLMMSFLALAGIPRRIHPQPSRPQPGAQARPTRGRTS